MIRMTGTTAYTYNRLDQLTAIDNPTGDDVTYAYDGRGNLTREMAGANITNYTYDARDRLTNVAAPGNTLAYVYDADGHRTRETANGTITNFVWDELSRYGDVILETNSSNVVQTRFVLGNGNLISQTVASTTSYFLPDVQGSNRALTNASGAIISGQTFDYSAFGDLVSTGTPNTDYLYTGQQFDASTGLYSLRARYYDPGVGRFNSRDTWAYNFQNPMEFNRYVYASGNPVRWSDSSGNNALGELALNLKRIGRVVTSAVGKFGWDFVGGFAAGSAGYAAGVLVGNLLIEELTHKESSVDNVGFGFAIILNGIAGGAVNVGSRIYEADLGSWIRFFFSKMPLEAAEYLAHVRVNDLIAASSGLSSLAASLVSIIDSPYAAKRIGCN